MYVYVVCIDTRRDNQTQMQTTLGYIWQQYPNTSASKPAYDLQMFQPGLIFKCSILNRNSQQLLVSHAVQWHTDKKFLNFALANLTYRYHISYIIMNDVDLEIYQCKLYTEHKSGAYTSFKNTHVYILYSNTYR